MKHARPQGYTLVELIISIFVFLVLVTLVTVNVATSQRHTTSSTSITAFITDMRQQQLKAMVGDTEGRGVPSAYGIYLEANRYTLFHGLSYVAGDSGNFVVNLDQNLQIQNPGTSIVFSRLSGEVYGYTNTANTVVIRDIVTNEQKTLQFNQYGVVTSVN